METHTEQRGLLAEQGEPVYVPGRSPDEQQCALFQFVVDSLITGLVCLFGFAGNTASFMTLWREKVCVSTFLLQAVIIADFTVLWMLFLGHSVPALAYVVPVLRDCGVATCRYVSMVTGPLMFLAHVCGIWLTVLALVNRYVLMCRPSRASEFCTLRTVKKHVITIIMTGVLLTLPQTFEIGVFVRGPVPGTREVLAQNYWYRLFYVDLLTLVVVYILPLLSLLYLLVCLARVVRSSHRLRRSLAASYRMQHMDLTQLLLTVTVTLVICYLPTVVTRVFRWAEHHPHERCASLIFYLDSFSNVFLALNSSIKVILLCMFVADFHAKLRRNMTCRRNRLSADGDGKMDNLAVTESASRSFDMYRCSDMSEMTLISSVDSRL